MKVLVTGGAGFIGANLVQKLIFDSDYSVVNVDCLSYAGNLSNLESVMDSRRHDFYRTNINEREVMRNILTEHEPQVVLHLAAESHVDNSIRSSESFISTNIMGTYNLLEEVTAFWSALPTAAKSKFKFLHVSTDEVYGSIEEPGKFFETSKFEPSSPYSASKAGSDLLVKAWHTTYGLPVIISNCSNNYGQFQHPEKLIPKIITNALGGIDIPIFGDGGQIRDWIYVADHVNALIALMTKGVIGETYNVGGGNERRNIDVALKICKILDHKVPSRLGAKASFADLISFVTDRAGHDFRYSIDCSKIMLSAGWAPNESFETGLDKTIDWYLQNEKWVAAAIEKSESEG